MDSVEYVEFIGGWHNCSNASPEGNLKGFPDSRKGVRQFNRFISIFPFFTKAILHKRIIKCNCCRLLCRGLVFPWLTIIFPVEQWLLLAAARPAIFPVLAKITIREYPSAVASQLAEVTGQSVP